MYGSEETLRPSNAADGLHLVLLFRGYWPGHDDLVSVDPKSGIIDFKEFPYEHNLSTGTNRRKAMHVMLVSESQGVAERVGVGKIHFDAWQGAGPQRRIVSLA